MALTTSAVHGDAALGGVPCGAALRSPQREPCTATQLWGRRGRGGVVTRGAALRSASPCWLVSAAVFL